MNELEITLGEERLGEQLGTYIGDGMEAKFGSSGLYYKSFMIIIYDRKLHFSLEHKLWS
jgi:hypothetical protein